MKFCIRSFPKRRKACIRMLPKQQETHWCGLAFLHKNMKFCTRIVTLKYGLFNTILWQLHNQCIAQLHIIKDAIIVVIFLCVLRYLHLIIANNLPTIMCKSWHVAVGAVSKRYSEDYLTRVQKYVSIKKERSSKRAIFYLFKTFITFIQSLLL